MQAHLRQPTSNTWTELAPLGVSRANLAGAVLDGQFYAIRGRHSLYASTVTVYNPISNTCQGREVDAYRSRRPGRGGAQWDDLCYGRLQQRRSERNGGSVQPENGQLDVPKPRC